MTDKIVQLAQHRAPVNEEAIREVEEVLRELKAGEVMAVAIASARRDHARCAVRCYRDGYNHDLMAAVMDLNWRMCQDMSDQPGAQPL